MDIILVIIVIAISIMFGYANYLKDYSLSDLLIVSFSIIEKYSQLDDKAKLKRNYKCYFEIANEFMKSDVAYKTDDMLTRRKNDYLNKHNRKLSRKFIFKIIIPVIIKSIFTFDFKKEPNQDFTKKELNEFNFIKSMVALDLIFTKYNSPMLFSFVILPLQFIVMITDLFKILILIILIPILKIILLCKEVLGIFINTKNFKQIQNRLDNYISYLINGKKIKEVSISNDLYASEPIDKNNNDRFCKI